jgi:predicted RNA polymerase sigma factor
MHVLYLIFSEGYAVSGGPELVRTDLSSEALRLTRMLHRLVPEDSGVAGLLANVTRKRSGSLACERFMRHPRGSR